MNHTTAAAPDEPPNFVAWWALHRIRPDGSHMSGRRSDYVEAFLAGARCERERWRGLVQEALDADEGDYVLGEGLADKLRAALRA